MKVYEQVAGPSPRLFLPVDMQSPGRSVAGGPQFVVVTTIYENQPDAAAQELWSLSQSRDRQQFITLLAGANILIAHAPFGGPVHDHLESRCLTSEEQEEFRRHDSDGLQNRSQLFQGLGVLISLKTFIACGSTGDSHAAVSWQDLGHGVMAANVFVTGPHYREGQGSIETKRLLVEQLASWEISNTRDLAYSIARSGEILKKHLRSIDPRVERLRNKLGLDPNLVTVAGVPLDEYFGIVLGFFSALNVVKPEEILQGTRGFKFDIDQFFARMTISREHYDAFLAHRARTISQFREAFAGKGFESVEELAAALKGEQFAADFREFRKTPFIVIESGILVPISLSFIAELLAVGVYWSIFDSFESRRRSTFAELWGALFHMYAAELLRFAYPSGATSPLAIEAEFDGGAADALLDLGDTVLLFEFKGSLLTQAARCEKNVAVFEQDFRRKFVETADGEGKGISQLAAACIAVREGRLGTSMQPKAIFPVLVCYEAAMESFFMNSYANDIFEPMVSGQTSIQPLTLMSIEELEGILPYIVEGEIKWAEFLKQRFRGRRVVPQSVSQTLYDWRLKNGIASRRNDFLLAAYKDAFKDAVSVFKKD